MRYPFSYSLLPFTIKEITLPIDEVPKSLNPIY